MNSEINSKKYMTTEDYNKGWNDASEYYLETSISLEKVGTVFDSFFDKINDLKKIVKMFCNHHINLSINNEELNTRSEKTRNLKEILEKVKDIDLTEKSEKNEENKESN